MQSDAPATFTSADMQKVQASNGITYAFRRVWTPPPDSIPVVMLQHFRGNIDSWDPALVDGLAAGRDVIAFDNTGIGATGGTTPDTAEQMVDDAITFLDALGFGRSIRSATGSGVRGPGDGTCASDARTQDSPREHGRKAPPAWSPGPTTSSPTWSRPTLPAQNRFYLSSMPTLRPASRPAAPRWAASSPGGGRDPDVSLEARKTQYYKAVLSWGARDWEAVAKLADITQPTLIFQGDNDVMIPTRASHTLAGLIPDAGIVVFPDASHGAIFQYATEAATQTLEFLDA